MKYFINNWSRGLLTVGLLSGFLAGCTTDGPLFSRGASTAVMPAIIKAKPLEERYLQPTDEAFRVSPEGAAKIAEKFQRAVVSYPSSEAPGTIIVEPHTHYLYLIAGRGKAVRYGVGVGSAGLGFTGDTNLQHKQKWPRWIPTKDMITRNPKQYKKYAGGVDGGLGNPMGARALYLYQNNKDTYYRIHGTNAPSSIGKSVSAGCIRMLNNDVIDLYERVQPGSKVIVR